MQYYISNTKALLENDRILNLQFADSKKQKTLIMFIYPDINFTLSEHIMLCDLAKKIPIEYRVINSQEEFMLSLGVLLGSKTSKDEIFTILDNLSTIPDFVKEKYEIKEFVIPKKTRNPKIMPQKSTQPKKQDTTSVTTASTPQPSKVAKVKAVAHTDKTSNEKPPEILISEVSKNNLKTNKVSTVKTDIKLDNSDIPKTTTSFKSKKTSKNAPSLKEGTDRNLFIKLMEVTPEDIGFEGTVEELAMAIADIMIEVRDNDADFEPELKKKFGAKAGKTIYDKIHSKFILLSTTLRS